MLRNGFFGNLWKLYAPERKFRAENGGLSRGTYPICIHMEVLPPPPRIISFQDHLRRFENVSSYYMYLCVIITRNIIRDIWLWIDTKNCI